MYTKIFFRTGIIEEILACERGKQWILSCFGPKDERCIPGMEDVSPEEVRWQIYEAKKNGTIDQVVRVLHPSFCVE